MLRAHAFNRLARAQKAAHDVDGEHALQTGGAHGVHPGANIHHARVVDKCSHAAQLGIDLVEKPQDVGLHSHIGLHGHRGASARTNLAHHFIGSERIGGVVHGNRVATLGGKQRRGSTNAA